MQFLIQPPFKKSFKRLAKKYPSLPSDLNELRLQLLEDPQLGESLGMSCYKIRLNIASKKAGKSGGARVITCVRIVEDEVHFLEIFDKSELDNISHDYIKSLVELYIEN